MKPIFWAGVALLVLGAASLVIPIPRSEREGVKFGGVSIGLETQHNEKAPVAISAVMILGGVGLLIASNRRQA